MVIAGLTEYIKKRPHFICDYKLHDCRVVIDGESFVKYIYVTNKINTVCGGNYTEFSKVVNEYLSKFMQCGITPVIVFRGSIIGNNLKHIESRWHDRLRKVKTITENLEIKLKDSSILPLHAVEDFKLILLDLKIATVQCQYGGTSQIVAIANYCKSPVIGYYNDFYLMNIDKGFISIYTISELQKDNDKKYLTCKYFHISSFMSVLIPHGEEILPWLASIAHGNLSDYLREFWPILKLLSHPSIKHDRIAMLIDWLRCKEINQITTHLERYVDAEYRAKFLEILQYLRNRYTIETAHLKLIFDEDTKNLTSVSSTEPLTTPCKDILPDAFCIAYNEGQMTQIFLDILTFRKIFLFPQIEMSISPSIYRCCSFIRQVLYSILMHHCSPNAENSEVHKSLCLKYLTEYGRQRDELSTERISLINSLPNGAPIPKLWDVYKMERKKKLEFFAHVVGVSSSFIESIPSSLQLLFASIYYWTRNGPRKPTKTFQKAMLLCIMYFNIFSQTTLKDNISRDDKEFDNNLRHILVHLRKISPLFNKKIARKMNKYLLEPTCKELNFTIVFHYSQLQTCLFCMTLLNKLLLSPLKPVKLYEVLNGVMYYNLTEELKNQQNPDNFIEHLLGKYSPYKHLFDVFYSKIYG